MSTEVRVVGRVRQVMQSLDSVASGDAEQPISLSNQLENLFAQGAAPYQEIVRSGRSFLINTTTAVASVVALPTTAVTLALYNNAPDGGRSLIIDWVAGLNIVAAATAGQAGIIANVGQVRAAAPTNSALVAKKLNGYSTGANPDTVALSIVGGTALDAATGRSEERRVGKECRL